MEDLIQEIIAAVTDKFSDLSEAINIDDVMHGVTDAVHSTIESLSDAGTEIDENTKQSIISRIIEAFEGTDTSSVIENLNFISEHPIVDLDASSEISFQGTSSMVVENADISTDINKATNGSQISFGSGDCWDECYATVKDHGKRLMCGYQY